MGGASCGAKFLPLRGRYAGNAARISGPKRRGVALLSGSVMEESGVAGEGREEEGRGAARGEKLVCCFRCLRGGRGAKGFSPKRARILYCEHGASVVRPLVLYRRSGARLDHAMTHAIANWFIVHGVNPAGLQTNLSLSLFLMLLELRCSSTLSSLTSAAIDRRGWPGEVCRPGGGDGGWAASGPSSGRGGRARWGGGARRGWRRW
jgi:hypothetical protein